MTRPIVHDGTAETQRHPAPLQPGYFNVAEMELETLLAYGVDYSGLINYYNANNTVEGDWTRFLTGDETMVLAHIAATDMTRMEVEFHHACEQPAHLRPWAAVNQAAFIHRLARRLDDWHTWLGAATGKPGNRVRRVIERLIRRQLAHRHNQLRKLLEQYPHRLLEKHNIDTTVFSKIWTVNNQSQEHGAARRGTPEINEQIQSCFHSFHNAATLIVDTAVAQFKQALSRSDHEPSLALFISFIQLLRQSQQVINRFATRRLDYYYRDILQIQSSGHVPDTTFLVLALDGSLPDVVIRQGTEFTAGKDHTGKTLAYTADDELRVTDTNVTVLHTLYFEKNPLMSPEKELGHVTGAWKATLPPLDLNVAPDEQKNSPNPLFGSSADQAEEKSASSITMGLAIADPVLLLGQGQRRITLEISFKAAAEAHPAHIVKQLAQSARTTVQDAFYKVFKRMFTITLTADSGWYEVESYLPDSALINPAMDENCLRLGINLPPEAPGIVSYSPELHGKHYEIDQPMVHLSMNDQNDLYPYSLLKALTVSRIRIDVAVQGSRDLMAYNQHGQLDPSGPFQPFGPLPDIGAYLMVGSNEAASKHLTAFEVLLEWDALPGGRFGMQHHYREYVQSFQPDLYKVKTTLLANGRWQPAQENEQGEVNLFRVQSCQGRDVEMAPQSPLPVHHLSLHTPVTATDVKNDFAFNLNARSGFFKFTLSNPPYVFGHKAYPFLLSRALTANALKKKKASLPKPPYTPVVRSMEINYEAFSEIKMEQGASRSSHRSGIRVIHLHPFGWAPIYPQSENRLPSFVPDYGQGGNLLIGLGGASPWGTLTLFFHIRSKTQLFDADPRPVPRWYYLSSDQWMELPQRRIISDTTRSFTSSGVITLDIPAGMNNGHTILPGHCFWLRVCADQGSHRAGHLLGVAAHALTVTWQDLGNATDHLQAPLPAGRIHQSVNALPGIGKILQPCASTGGRAAETGSNLTTRISERLRHKNRAVTSWDYERLVLERFPEIYKAKCFAGTSRSDGMDIGGRVLMAVIPQLDATAQSPDQQPMVDDHLLDSIRDHLSGLASPFADIEVCNPVYEQIQVRCTVQLHPSAKAGAHIKRINQAINHYLSPWSQGGRYQARFGWCIRRADLEAYLLGLEHVAYITRFSMLHIVRETADTYGLFDTAGAQAETLRTRDIKPKFPWGIAVPVKHHYIHTVGDYRPDEPRPAGIDDIKIGETFIITGT